MSFTKFLHLIFNDDSEGLNLRCLVIFKAKYSDSEEHSPLQHPCFVKKKLKLSVHLEKIEIPNGAKMYEEPCKLIKENISTS